jgi:hypothetical protein
VSLGTLVWLFVYDWPHINHLRTDSNPFHSSASLKENEIDMLWRSFDHLEKFSFDRQCVTDLARLFNSMTTTVSSVLIYQSDELTHYDPPFITREWLETNTKLDHFDYLCNAHGTVRLWL